MNRIKQSPIITFFCLAYLLSWLVWASIIAEDKGLLSWHIPGMLAYAGLATAAFVTAYLTSNRTGIRDLLNRIVRWQVNPLWVLVVVSITLPLGLIAIVIYQSFGNTHQIGIDLTNESLLPFYLNQLVLMIFTEELAWRGFALPRLQKHFTALNSSLILGLLWGFWHLPLFLQTGSSQMQYPFPVFILTAVALTILMTWIFNHTRGSVLIAALFHAAFNTTVTYLGILNHGQTLAWIFCILMYLMAFVVVFMEGHIHLTRMIVSNEDTIFFPAPISSTKS